jgi:hypothetical protein
MRLGDAWRRPLAPLPHSFGFGASFHHDGFGARGPVQNGCSFVFARDAWRSVHVWPFAVLFV